MRTSYPTPFLHSLMLPRLSFLSFVLVLIYLLLSTNPIQFLPVDHQKWKEHVMDILLSYVSTELSIPFSDSCLLHLEKRSLRVLLYSSPLLSWDSDPPYKHRTGSYYHSFLSNSFSNPSNISFSGVAPFFIAALNCLSHVERSVLIPGAFASTI